MNIFNGRGSERRDASRSGRRQNGAGKQRSGSARGTEPERGRAAARTAEAAGHGRSLLKRRTATEAQGDQSRSAARGPNKQVAVTGARKAPAKAATAPRQRAAAASAAKASTALERVRARQAARAAAAAGRPARAAAATKPARPVRLVQSRAEAARPAEDEAATTDQRRRASAGRIIAVGLLCFFIWLLFDANQLYHSAQAGQIGTRRTVAVIFLRPLAAVSDALHLSGPVNAADSALGRCGIGGAPACTNPTTIVPVTTTIATTTTIPPVHIRATRLGYLGLLAAPHLGAGDIYPPPPVPPWPPPIASPTPSHPLVLLSIGDSIGEDLGFGLGDVFSSDPAVTVVQKGVESTGLARADYYNWPAVLASDLHHYHPKIVVVMMGANDAQSFYDGGGKWLPFGTAAWWQAYTARVALLMEEATAAGAHVLWVGLPPMGAGSTVPPTFPHELNKIFRAEAHLHYGVEYFSAAQVLSTKKGGFTLYMTIGGSIEQIRSTDGVHLLPPGYDLLAQDLVAPMEQDWHVNLGVG